MLLLQCGGCQSVRYMSGDEMKPTYFPDWWKGLADFDRIAWDTRTDARQECFMAHVTGLTYTYGTGRGIRSYTSVAILPWVSDIAAQLAVAGAGENHNVCFLNRYADEHQHLGWHADDSPGMDHAHQRIACPCSHLPHTASQSPAHRTYTVCRTQASCQWWRQHARRRRASAAAQLACAARPSSRLLLS